jgi:hypothetical protein
VTFSLFSGPIKTGTYKTQKAPKSVFLEFFDSLVMWLEFTGKNKPQQSKEINMAELIVFHSGNPN